MKRLYPALLVVTALLCSVGRVQAACNCDWICIESADTAAGTGLKALNASPVPLTFTIEFSSRRYLIDGPSTLTMTLPAGQSYSLPVVERSGASNSGRRPYRCDWTIGNKDASHDDEYLYMLPYESGRSFRVLQGFGSRFSHTGIEQFAVDFKMPEGTPVHAARAGVVAYTEARFSRGCWSDECAGEANYIVILHDDETTGEYYHLHQDGVLVAVGDRVEAGQKIGLSGNTGHSALPHLHFGVYRAIDRGKEQSVPFRFLSADGIVDLPRRGGMYVAIDAHRANERALDPAASTQRPATGGF